MNRQANCERGPLSRFVVLRSGNFIDSAIVSDKGHYPVYGANGQIGWTDCNNYSGVEVVVGRVGSCGAITVVEEPAWITDNTIVLEPSESVDPVYLAYALRVKDLRSLASSSIQPLLTQRVLAAIEVCIPPLSEQKRIAARLDEQMATLARAQAALAAQREAATALRSAVLRTALDPATHPDWPMVSIGSICNLNPVRPPLVRRDSEPTSFVPMSAVDELDGTIPKVAERPYGEVKKGYTCFQEGDVLFAKITPCMQNGKSAIARELIDRLGFGSTEFHVLRPSAGVTSEWIHLWLRQQRILEDAARHFTGAVGQQRVPADYLALLNIPLPLLSEQHCITEQLADSKKQLDALVVSLNDEAAMLDSLRTSLLDAAFSGQV